MEDIHTIIHRKKERLKKINDFNYITTIFDKFKELKRKYIEEIQNQQIEALTDEDIENIKAASKFNDLFGNIF